MAAGERAEHRAEQGLPQPITVTDELLLALHHEVHLLRLRLTPPAPAAHDDDIALQEPAGPASPPRRRKS